MVNKLAVIAVTGITAFAVCLGGAAAISGGNMDMLDIGMFGGKAHCAQVPGATATSRTLDWDGSDHAGLAMPATANYAPGTDDKVHASGDPQVLAHLRVRDGTVEMDCRSWRSAASQVVITLPGRTFKKFILTGTGKMNLERLEQPDLKVQVAGVATIKANGRVDDLRIEMAGVSHADFARVSGRKVHVKLAGVSQADIAPSDEAHVEIAGPSEVTLHSNPRTLETDIAGPGRLRKLAGGS